MGEIEKGENYDLLSRGVRARLSHLQYNAVTSVALSLEFSRLKENRVSDATRAWSLVKRFHLLALRSPASPEAFFQVPIWRSKREIVVAVVSVLLDSGCIKEISSIQPCLMAYEDNALARNRPLSLSLLRLRQHGGRGFEGSAADSTTTRGSRSGDVDHRVGRVAFVVATVSPRSRADFGDGDIAATRGLRRRGPARNAGA